jgi:ADP-heptose:LPS heptosyltransferase
VKGVKFDLPFNKCYIFASSKSMKLTTHNASASVRPRICVLFPGALGDFICFLPSLHVLARDAEVHLYAHSEFADLVPTGVAMRSLERTEIRKLFAAGVRDHEQAQKFFASYAVIYSWFGSQQTGFVRRLRTASRGAVKVFPFRPADARIHQIDHYLNCLNQSVVLDHRPVIELRYEGVRWRDDFWHKHAFDRRPVLTVAPGSGAREKNWPEPFFLAVADWWRDATGGAVVLLIGPVEEERGGVERLRDRCVVASGLRLSQVAALVAGSDVYLGNDSGISHLAAAVGVRTVVLFGPSDIAQWSPRGSRVTIVSRHIECSPCQSVTMKKCSHRDCLTAFYPSEVVEVLEQLPEVVTLTAKGAGIRV